MTPVEIRPNADPPKAGQVPNPPRVGDRIRIVGILPNDPAPLEIGDEGTVERVDDGGTAHTRWDSGRTLGVVPTDPFVVVSRPEQEYAAPVEEGEVGRG